MIKVAFVPFILFYLFVNMSVHTSVRFVAVFVNVTQDNQIEGAIVSARGQQE